MPGRGIELAVAYVSIVGETSKLASGVKSAVADAQKTVGKSPLRFEADTSSLKRAEAAVQSTARKLQAARDSEADAAGRVRAAETKLAEVRDNAKAKASQIAAAEETLGRARRAQQAASREVARITGELDQAQSRASSSARTAAQAHRRTAVEFGASHAAASRLSGSLNLVTKGLGGVATAGGGVAAGAAGIGAIGGAAGAALGAVSALTLGAAALGPAFLAAAATATVGLSGIKDAFKALGAQSQSSGADQAAQAKAVAAAQKQVTQAHKQVSQAVKDVGLAEKDVGRAQQDSRTAQLDLNRARVDAKRDLDELNRSLRGAALSERDAQLAVLEARRDLANLARDNPNADALDRERAVLRVQEAEQRLADVQSRNTQLAQDAADANAKGVEGSDSVVRAKERVADADERVTDAESRLRDARGKVVEAQQGVTEAEQNLSDAMNKTSPAADKAAQALAKLSPNARSFVLAMHALTPEWQAFKNQVQDPLFAGLDTTFTDLARNTLPLLGEGMGQVSAAMNQGIKDTAAFLQTAQAQGAIRNLFAGTADAILQMQPGLKQAAQGMVDFTSAAGPALGGVGAAIGGMAGQIGQAFSDAANSGAITQLVNNFSGIITGLGQGLNPLIDGFIEMANIVGPVLGPFLAQLGTSLGSILPSLGQLGATFLTSLQPVLPVLAEFITALADGLQPVLPVLGGLLQALGPALTPLIGPLSQIAQTVGSALTQAITALAPAIGPVGEAFASLITAVAPILPVLAEVASGILQALAPALKTIFDALGPVIKQWADLMMPVFRQLQPILADVAQKIGTALAGAIQQIAPILPQLAQSFGGLITAIAPLLPQIVDLAVSFLPPLIDILVQMAPVITKIIDAFTWLVNNVIGPIVIPALVQLAETFKTNLDGAGAAVKTAKNIIGGGVEAIGSVFTGLGSTVTTVWDAIVRTIKFAVRKIGEFLVGLPEVSIPDIPGIPGRGTKIGFKGIGQSMVDWAGQGLATGGLFRGIGGTTSDSNLVALSDREFIVNAAATARNLPLLEAINAGWVPSASFLRSMVGDIPGFAGGGRVPGKDFAVSMDSAGYSMEPGRNFTRSSIDCSGMVSAVVNDALGRPPFESRMSTVTEGGWLAARGAKPGLGPAGSIQIGWFDHGGGANGHTAMTLSDGTNVESNGSDGVIIGGPVGAAHRMFDHHAHIPPELLRGGDLGGPAGAAPSIGGGSGGSGSGGTGGGGGGTGGASGGLGGGSDAAATGDGTRVFVTNWPTGITSTTLGGPATTSPAATGTTSTPALSSSSPAGQIPKDPMQAFLTGFGAVPPAGSPPNALPPIVTNLTDSLASSAGFSGVGDAIKSFGTPPVPGTDPAQAQMAAAQAGFGLLKNLPGKAGEVFDGPAPWYLAATPEQAALNLGTQAAQLAVKTGSGFVDLVKNNWKEVAQTGLAVAGMGAVGGGGGQPPMVNHFNGMDPQSAAAAVERQWRRRTLANQRRGGYTR